MANHEQAVRDAAAALKTAIEEAEAAGYRVDLPAQVADIDKVAVSATAKVAEEQPQAKPPRRPFADGNV